MVRGIQVVTLEAADGSSIIPPVTRDRSPVEISDRGCWGPGHGPSHVSCHTRLLLRWQCHHPAVVMAPAITVGRVWKKKWKTAPFAPGKTHTSLWVRWSFKRSPCNYLLCWNKKDRLWSCKHKGHLIPLIWKEKNPIPLQTENVLPEIPIRAIFHPPCKIQDTKILQERKPKSHSCIRFYIYLQGKSATQYFTVNGRSTGKTFE